MIKNIYVGTAAWSIPKIASAEFSSVGSHLERYAHVLSAVEINTSFYRHHQAKSYARWAQSVPENFRFSVKLFKGITHENKLKVKSAELAAVLAPISELKDKWGVLLVQLPKSVEFHLPTARNFFSTLRDLTEVNVACEPRDPTWHSDSAIALFEKFRISKVDADPEPCPAGEQMLTAGGFRYLRLHGSPQLYRSNYEPERIEEFARKLNRSKCDAWCIYDNTTFGHATLNAVQTHSLTKTCSAPL